VKSAVLLGYENRFGYHLASEMLALGSAKSVSAASPPGEAPAATLSDVPPAGAAFLPAISPLKLEHSPGKGPPVRLWPLPPLQKMGLKAMKGSDRGEQQLLVSHSHCHRRPACAVISGRCGTHGMKKRAVARLKHYFQAGPSQVCFRVQRAY